MKKIDLHSFFAKNLMIWHKNDNERKMPWKGEKDPYRVWLSEIILQQTRVEQGLSYYNKFIIKYPTINELALANENDVFKMWEGLGYYSRCKNLIATARLVSFELKGVFPSNYENILQLKGVGPYTAAAIASFAYNLPNAVVDGNVLRILARFFGVETPVDSATGKKYFTDLANQLLVKTSPALYNQAIMDFGATICKPALPLCSNCVLNEKCIALKKKKITTLPVKEKKLVKTFRYFYYIIAEFNNKIYVQKRVEKDIWQNLWQFILIEEKEKKTQAEILAGSLFSEIVGKKYNLINISSFYKQQLTHQTIEGLFIHIKLLSPLKNKFIANFEMVNKKEITTLAFPRFITNYFEDQKK
jgi:A/G-specific adenine glycosylase